MSDKSTHIHSFLRLFDGAEKVMLARPDGSYALFCGDSLVRMMDDPPAWSGSRALELAADSVAVTRLTRPDAPAALWDQIIQTQVQAMSPIEPTDLVWGWRLESPETDQIVIALTSKRRITEQLKSAGAWQPDEIWAATADGHVVLRGFREEVRARRERRRQRATVAALLFLTVCIMLASLAPVAAQRSQLNQASAALSELRSAATPAMNLRDRSLKLATELEALTMGAALSAQTLDIVQLLTLSLPDSAYLNRLEIEGARVMASGQASDAASLIETLGRHPAFGDLRTRGSITRDRDGRDAFNIEFEYRHAEAQAND